MYSYNVFGTPPAPVADERARHRQYALAAHRAVALELRRQERAARVSAFSLRMRSLLRRGPRPATASG